MKILQLLSFPLYGSGSGSYVRKLSQELVAKGQTVAIVCPDKRTLNKIKIYPVNLPIKAAFTGHPEWPEVKLYSNLTASQLNLVQESFQQAIIRAVEEFKPDVIHVHHASNLTWIANYIRAVYRIDYLVTSHNTDLTNAIVDKRYIPLTEDALAKADFVMAVSSDTRNRLIKVFGKSHQLKPKTRVIPVGVDIDQYSPNYDTSLIDKKYNLTNKKVVLFSGKLIAHKGVEYLLKAASSIKGEIIIVGGGEDEEVLKKLSKKLGNTNVHWLGYMDKKQAKKLNLLYARANVVVVPSIASEGTPMAAVEASASGTPVVATNKGGIPFVVRDHKNGLLIRPRSSRAITEAINEILTNPKLGTRLGKEGRHLAETIFSWNSVTDAYIRYYEKTYINTLKRRKSKKAEFIKDTEYLENKNLLDEKSQDLKKEG